MSTLTEISRDLTIFFESHEQPTEVNPVDRPYAGLDCVFLRERKVVIIIHYLSRSNSTFSPDDFPDFTIVHLWEDVWRQSQEIVKARLLSIIGRNYRLPARVMNIRRIDQPTSSAFLDEHHLQGSTKARFKYGLFLPENYYRLVENKTLIDADASETLMAVATFAAPKTYYRETETVQSGELIRFVNHSGFTVVGGLAKILKMYEREQEPDDIATVVDADWSSGHSYEKLGFERIKKTESLTFFVNKNTFERQRRPPEADNGNFVKVENSGNWKFIKKCN